MARIRIYGPQNNLGFGIFCSGLVGALKNLNVIGSIVEHVDLMAPDRVKDAVGGSSKDDINIWFLLNPSIRLSRGINVVWSIFESDTLDFDYIRNYLTFAHVIWTPSAWGKQVLTSVGVPADRIDVVPGGVNPLAFHPLLRENSHNPNTVFRFLAVGKFEKRKAYEPLLESFLQAFNNDSSVVLDIKGDFFLNHQERKSELERLVQRIGVKNVNLVWGMLDDQAMFALYNRASVFVYPSRAEGWGLPLIEALAMGIPSITTYYSGHTEFLDSVGDLVMKVGHTLTSIDDDTFYKYWPNLKGLGPRWAEPSQQDLIVSMLQSRADYSKVQSNALKASRIIRREFSWENSADVALGHIMRRQLLAICYQ